MLEQTVKKVLMSFFPFIVCVIQQMRVAREVRRNNYDCLFVNKPVNFVQLKHNLLEANKYLFGFLVSWSSLLCTFL